ncbi:Dyp-type peroxidase [Segniliparus rugosus]|uniref:Dyp-type peroxidase n=1 Tax=Segniliparus rugosus (strain ATCC BAA-974 / DSM 45345 / CCUG 50838 / CIP 108380 / JCM 13579 / CDC 945) TaxID=679197 RepID=E5XQE1_SEGRC|nr:Dyp-type peroxidase [Segniliparus rugosus]EFV13424.1 dyp-type peroxidase [Segniliparus rugosus ATCC BAA-974]
MSPDGAASEAAAAQPVQTLAEESAIFLVLSVEDGGEEVVRDVLSRLANIQRAVRARRPDGGLSCVAGIGSLAWDRLYSGPKPAKLHVLPEFAGARHASVSTPGDLLLHIRAQRTFLSFEMAAQTLKQLGGAVRVVDEVRAFRSFEERDLLGFVEGTENPSGTAATAAISVTAEQDPDFAGASYVVVQKYLHDLEAWGRVPVEEQEQIIGRGKLDDIEIPDERKRSNAHIVLNSVTDERGVEQKIVRVNMPFGSFQSGEFGTYFIGYTNDPGVIETMLANMFVGSPPGNYDHVLDFSTAVTGSLFFVPTQSFLEDPPKAPAGARASLGR